MTHVALVDSERLPSTSIFRYRLKGFTGLFQFSLVRLAAIILGLAILAGPEAARAQRPLGIDVSSAQGVIDWSQVVGAGFDFAWCEATEGTNILDPMYTTNVVQAQSFGLPIGMYHIARPDLDPGTAGADLEAAYFWTNASNFFTVDGLSLMPALVYEIAPTGSNDTAATSSQWVNEWCQDIVNYGLSNGLALTPVVFTETGFITNWFDISATNWPLWYANPNGRNPLTSTPGSTRPWPTWTFWQYGLVFNPGVESGICNGDVFNGTVNTLQNYVISGSPPTITTQPTNVTVTETGTASFSVSAINDAIGYQWLLNGNSINGATNATLTVTNVQMSDAGDYSVIVSGPYASSLSLNALLTVNPLVSIYNVTVTPRLTSAIITWTTTTNATAQALYGTATGTNYSSVLPVNPALTVQHSMLLVGLQTNATYYFELVSSNGPYVGTYTGSFSTDLSLVVKSSQAAYSGVWTVDSAAPDKYATYYEFAETVNSADTADAIFRPYIAAPGLYDVYLWYSQGTNRSSVAPVTVGYQGGGTEVFVNETTNGGSWQLIASGVPFAVGTNGYVRLGNGSGEPNKIVIADAVQFTFNAAQDLPVNNMPPAWWLNYYFGTNNVNATQDPDGDGYSTLAEYVIGTAPNDPASHLRVRGQAAAGGGVQVIFSPYYFNAGRQYQLQSRSSVTNGAWTNLPPLSVTTNTNGEGVMTVTNLSGSQNFLRLSVTLTQ